MQTLNRNFRRRLGDVASLAVRSRRSALFTVVAWIVFASLISSLAPKLADVESNKDVNDPPAAAQSMEARTLQSEAFEGGGTPAVIVVRDPAGLDRADRQEIGKLVADLEAAGEKIGNLGEPVSPLGPAGQAGGLLSRDGATAQIIVPISGASSDDALGDTVARIRGIAERADGNLEIAVTGPAGIVRDVTEAFGGASLVLLAATVLLVLILLLIIYRSPLLAIMPIIAVSVALTITNGLGAIFVNAGLFSVSSQAASIMTVLLFGVGTDYSLFIVGRYREELEREPDRYKAMQAAMRNLVEPLASSALTVVLALMTLLLATLPALRGFGPFFALAVIVMVLLALTFIPAIVCLFGRAALWPRRFSARRESRFWRSVAGLVTRRPVATGTAAAVVLAVFALGLTQYRESFNFISGLRVATESERGQKMLDEAFPPGSLAPTTLLITTGGKDPAESGPALEQLRGVLAGQSGIESVSPPAFSQAKDVVRLQIIYRDDPYGPAALDRTDRLRSLVPDELDGTALAGSRVLFGGESAVNLDIRSANDRDLLVIVPAIAIVTFLVLALLLWSLAAPLYLVATLIASYVATMGVTVMALLVLGGDDGIGVRVAIYTFVFLVALGVDYNIFLMTRVREETARRAHGEGVRLALVRTGPVITSAGLILAGTFGVLMTQPVRELYQFGFAMAFGLLLDTFLVRGVLVPAITTRLGSKAWWPDRRRQEATGEPS